MTEKEALKALKLEGGLEIIGKATRTLEFFEGLVVAEEALEEIQAYRAIGTVEECRTAVERMKPRKIKGRSLTHEGYVGNCPCCGKLVALHDDNKICRKCGQAFDWSE